MKDLKIGLIGGTGMVGSTILKVLEERQVDIGEIFIFSSAKSKGQEIEFMGKKLVVEELTKENFLAKPMDIGLFSAGGAISREYIPLALEEGIICIDNSSEFRMDEEVPLIIPEVNAGHIKAGDLLIANPNCSTIQSVMAIKPIFDRYGINRIVYNTYQAVSGSGMGGIRDLEEGLIEKYPYSIRENCLPHIDEFLENGYTKEEMKMIYETKKILGDDDLRVTATTVRVPVKNSHGVSINLELKSSFELEDIRKILSEFPGLIVKDDISKNLYPLAQDSNGGDGVFVGRIRRDDSLENGLNLWCVADNIRKGAASNTVQIAGLIIEGLKEA